MNVETALVVIVVCCGPLGFIYGWVARGLTDAKIAKMMKEDEQ